MNVRVVQIASRAELDAIRPVVIRALTEIGARSGGRHAPEAVYETLLRKVEMPDRAAVWVSLDESALAAGATLDEAVTGLVTLDLVEDEVGIRCAYISRGWIRAGTPPGLPFDLALPHIERWARDRGCRRLISQTERSSAATAAERFDPRALTARVRSLVAYARWIYRRGFVMRETIFEKELTP